MSDSGKRFFTEFISDYFAECEEHLAKVRRDLLALENLANQARMDVTLGNNLLRSFHTIKGLSGMVGQKEAQELAHEMESYLRALLRDQVRHSGAGQDALIHGVRALEQVLAAARAGQAAPDITAMVQELAQLPGVAPLPDAAAAQEADLAAEPAPSPSQEELPPEPPLPPGARIWRFEFAPDPALVQRGINVNVIRTRLEEIGELRHARPLVQGEGKIAFEFLVATALEESAFSGWRQDGITYTLEQPFEPQVPGVAVDRQLTPEGLTLPLTIGQSSVVRVDLAKLDDLMQMVGELVISRASLENQVKNLEDRVPAAQWRTLQENSVAMERQLRALREGVMRVRMVPIGEVFQRLQFGAYDLGRDQQKTIIMEMEGQDTEIDKFVVDKMMDPLMHLVRNIVSHGLEPEPERVARGKPAQGKILLKAAMSGDVVVLDIADDGKGVNPDLVFARARALGLIDADALPDRDSVLDILCEPGFSIKDQADLVLVAAGALAKIGDRRAFEPLLDLLGHPQTAVRQAAIGALNSIGHPNMEGRMARMLTDPDRLVRISAIAIAGYFGYPSCADLLLSCCHDDLEEVRAAALENIAYLEDDRVLPILDQALKQETPRVKAAAARACSFLDHNLVWPHLQVGLQDSDPWVRYFSARSVGRQGLPEATPLLTRLIQQDPAPQVRIAAIEALGRIGGLKAIAVLAPLAEHDDLDMARAALTALGSIGHPQALGILLAVLQSPDSLRREEAVRALGERGGSTAEHELLRVADTDQAHKVRRLATQALAQLGTPEAIGGLLELCVQPDRREDCIAALAKLNAARIPLLAPGLKHDHPEVRRTAVGVLARLKHPEATDQLLAALKDLDREVRLAATLALKHLSSAKTRASLMHLARHDRDPEVRRAAQAALR